MAEHQGYKKRSREDWGSRETNLTVEHITLGAVLRIADALESMAIHSKNYEYLQTRIVYLERSIRSQTALIKKINKELKGRK